MAKKAPEKEKKRISKQALRNALRIFRYMRPYRVVFIIGLVFLFLNSGLSMVFPGLMGKLIDATPGEGLGTGLFDLQHINNVALLLLGVFFFQAIFSYLRIWTFAYVTENMLADLRQATYGRLIAMPMGFFSGRRVGELNSRISADVSLLQDTFTVTIAELIRQVLIIIIGIILLSYYSISLTLTMLAVIPVVALVAVFFGRFIKRLSKETQNKIADTNVIVEETLTAIQSVKAFANEALEMLRYGKATIQARDIAMRGAKWRGLFVSFIIFAMFGAVVLVIWRGVILKEAGEITTGDLVTFVVYSVFIGASFGSIPDLFAKVQKAIGATEHLMELLDGEPEPIDPNNKDNVQIHGDVEFKNVVFAYPSRPDVQVLNGLTFKVAQGKKVALVGSSGAGKSTIAALLFRFYNADNGDVLIDGKKISSIPLSGLRANMALVPQEVILFGGTIKENIAYGDPDADDAAIIEAARSAYAHDFITGFPEGYDTLVGERGIQLSGGQRQRIAIARAMVKDPKMIVLDEATSALDAASESEVQKAFQRLMLGRTSFVIAHRTSTVKDADLILVLDGGRIVAQGTHDDLLTDRNGLYYGLTKTQLDQVNV